MAEGKRRGERRRAAVAIFLVAVAAATMSRHTVDATNPHEMTACATGKFHENGGCTDCPAGRWQEPNNHWLTRCKECPAGRYSASGASTCTDCAVGMYTNQNEQQTCRDCGVGFFQDRTRVSFTKTTVNNDNDKISTHDRMFLLKRPTRASIVYLGSSLIR